MTHLILIRHSISNPQADQSAHQWQLTAEGQARCIHLADAIRHYQPTRFYSSDEPKALDTAKGVMQALNIPPDGLQADVKFRETARATAPFFDRHEDFQQAIHQAMLNPDDLCFGEETFSDALKRFSRGIDELIQAHPTENVAIVSHGTILSLYIAHQTGRAVFPLWRSLDMPAYAVFSLPAGELIALKERI